MLGYGPSAVLMSQGTLNSVPSQFLQLEELQNLVENRRRRQVNLIHVLVHEG